MVLVTGRLKRESRDVLQSMLVCGAGHWTTDKGVAIMQTSACNLDHARLFDSQTECTEFSVVLGLEERTGDVFRSSLVFGCSSVG